LPRIDSRAGTVGRHGARAIGQLCAHGRDKAGYGVKEFPLRVTVGNALAKEGVVELRQRGTRADRRVPKAEVVAAVREMAQTIS